MENELIAPGETARLTVAKYNAIRKYVEEKSSSHQTSFLLFIVVVLLSCLDILVAAYYSKQYLIANGYLFTITSIIT